MSAENRISEYFLGEDTPRPPSCFRHCDAPPWAKNLATALEICLSSLSLSTPYHFVFVVLFTPSSNVLSRYSYPSLSLVAALTV